MIHSQRPGGTVRRLRPLTEEERNRFFRTVEPSRRNADGGFDFEADTAITVLAAAGFFAPPPDKRESGSAWNDSLLAIALLRAIASRRNLETDKCFPSYETTAVDAGIPGGARHVQRLADRLLFKTGFLGRAFSSMKGNRKTVRFYDFGPILEAARMVESGWMPTIDPPAAAPCNRSGADATRARDCNRSGTEAIATARSAPLARSRLQPESAPALATGFAPHPCNRSGADANNMEHLTPKNSAYVCTAAGIAKPSHDADFAAWAWMQEDPVSVALAATGEGEEARKVYGAKLRDLKAATMDGEQARTAFVEECISFRSEIQNGQPVRNPGAALVARLERLRDHTPPQDTPAAAVPSPASIADAKRPRYDETPEEAQRRTREAIARSKRERPEMWGLPANAFGNAMADLSAKMRVPADA